MGDMPHSASFIAEASGTMYSSTDTLHCGNSTVPRRVGAWQRGARDTRGHERRAGLGWAGLSDTVIVTVVVTVTSSPAGTASRIPNMQI